MKIEGAQLETEAPKYGFVDGPYDVARSFQNRVAEWVHDGDEPVAVLRAPTGAGKTATFHELVAANDITLLVYPTNALLTQQANRFEEEGSTAQVLTGETLEGHHHERTENLLKTVNRFASDHDVVLTNPDILQAIVQDMYAGGQAMEFFDRFDAIVYDEFHFYRDLAASGLLLQLRIFADRNPSAQILLASATPSESFVEYVDSIFDIPVRAISPSLTSDGSKFRHQVRLNRRSADRILDDREAVVETLRENIRNVAPGETRAVLVFNSVKDSNDFHDFLAENHEDLFDRAEKDNGYDTDDQAVDLDEADFSILNTTSKGEVGLDYDIRHLIMETPRGPTAASDFLQRFGRAGREAPATVDVFGLGQVSWDERMSYDEFVDSVYDALRSSQMDLDRLADLVGMRAAHALHVREGYFNPELREDFATVREYDRWRGFIESVDGALGDVGGLGAPLQDNDSGAKLLQFTNHCFDAFRGLRGRSLSGQIKYPRGDRHALTNYDLLSTLRYYDIERIEDDDVVVLEQPSEEYPTQVTARLPGYESRPRDYGSSVSDIEDQLQRWIHREIDRANLDAVDVSTELLHLFFERIRLTQVVLPESVRCGAFEIDVETNGIPTVTVRRRDL